MVRLLALLALLPLLCHAQTADSPVTVDIPAEAFTIAQVRILQQRVERLEARVEKLEKAHTHKRKHK